MEFSGEAEISFDTGYSLKSEFKRGKLETELTLPSFKLWSPDSPNLHTIKIAINTDEHTETFGIREFKAEGRKLLLNGKSVKLYGVNRHESHPTFGAAMPPQLIAYDLRMLKNAGFNFIRGSHYPQRKTFLNLCDKMGFFVWEETLGWDVKGPKLHSEKFLRDQMEEAEKLTYRSFNHPCIVIRGFLNENESEKQETRELIRQLRDKIRSIDKHCLISYSSNRYEKDVCTDIPDVVGMNPYPGWYDSCYEELSGIGNIKRVLHELSENLPKDKPYLITEIGAEALYGFRDPLRARWSEEYQAELLEECCNYALGEDECAGISIWHFADTRSYVNGPNIYGRARGFNNKGILDEFRRPKSSWSALKKLVKAKYPVLLGKERS
jgi:beta-glucuronidase